MIVMTLDARFMRSYPAAQDKHMKTESQARRAATQESASRKARSYRSFLVVAQLQAEEIGHRIAQARNEAGLTQEEMAALASFSKRSLQDYEAGVTIPYRQMQEISQITGKPVDWFLHGAEGATQPAVAQELLVEALARVEAGLGEVTAELQALAQEIRRWLQEPPAKSSAR